MSNNLTTPKYPHIDVPLVGEDGNAFAILGRVSRIMRQHKIHDQWDEFYKEATSGNYDHLIMTVIRWFGVERDECSMGDDDDDDTCLLCGDDLYDCECE